MLKTLLAALSFRTSAAVSTQNPGRIYVPANNSYLTPLAPTTAAFAAATQVMTSPVGQVCSIPGERLPRLAT